MENMKEEVQTPESEYITAIANDKRRYLIIIISLLSVELVLACAFLKLVVNYDIQNRIIRQVEYNIHGSIETTAGEYTGETDFGYLFGKGVFKFNSKADYTGYWKNNQMEGTGRLQTPSDGTYTGEFHNSKKDGNGTMEWSDGAVYEGNWKNDQMSGQGKYIAPQNVTYTGTFKDNLFWQGECDFSNETGEYLIQYETGEIANSSILFKDGTKYSGKCSSSGIDGNGCMEYSTGDQYTGDFKNGKRTGNGVYIWESGDKYDGAWENDQMSGQGTYRYKKGIKVSGEFKKNKFIEGNYKLTNKFGIYVFTIKNGKATSVKMILKDGTTYEGDVKNGKLNGDAHIKYKNGDTYEGSVKKGRKSGRGTYKWKNGADYDGEWKKDQMSGLGIYTYPSKSKGLSLRGKFKNGKPYGTCTYTTYSYDIYKTEWENGRCIKVSK